MQRSIPIVPALIGACAVWVIAAASCNVEPPRTDADAGVVDTNSHDDGCPDRRVRAGDDCSEAPPDSGRTCEYTGGGCGTQEVECVDGAWRIVSHSPPAAQECQDLCDTACADDCCRTACYVEYACPGETVGHDAAICEGVANDEERGALSGVDLTACP